MQLLPSSSTKQNQWLAHRELINLIESLAFTQQLFLFHFHSSHQRGVEGHYLVADTTCGFCVFGHNTLGDPPYQVASWWASGHSIFFFQWIWLMLMDCMLWTPSLVPKNCFFLLKRVNIRLDAQASKHFIEQCHWLKSNSAVSGGCNIFLFLF